VFVTDDFRLVSKAAYHCCTNDTHTSCTNKDRQLNLILLNSESNNCLKEKCSLF
jgi:hypothetical protein